MTSSKIRRKLGIVTIVILMGAQVMAPRGKSFASTATESKAQTAKEIYEGRFKDLYADIKDPANGYFNKQGIPYHSVETLMVEAPDQGHESTSETASYLLWLEAMNGKVTGNYDNIGQAWDKIEKYYIPTSLDQPNQGNYNPNSPATYAAEHELPDYYPSKLEFDTKVGQDPLSNELKNTYGTPEMYGMHWLIDVDNFYGNGVRGDGVSTPSYINTYQRGKQESVWETVPHPSWEDFKHGKPGEGVLSLFTGDKSYSKQWRYTIASDADARAIQAMYDVKQWIGDDKQKQNEMNPYIQKASKMGDYLRYSMFDKYFMKIGDQGKTPGSGRDSEHYLLSWYYSWGGAIDGNWSWRIGCSHNHFGYQNPLSAYVLSNDDKFIPKSATAKDDWSKSLDRQLEFYQWLQSDEGGIAGGCTNSYNGSYDKYPAGTSTFYGMAYQQDPVYEDPGSNNWFGMQCWSMQRVAELYYQTGDKRAKAIMDKWAAWAKSVVKLPSDGTYLIPANLKWTGQPDTWHQTYTGNKNLHVSVKDYGTDVGATASLANTLLYYAKATEKYDSSIDYVPYAETAKKLLDRMWNLYRDDKGVAATEVKDEYNRFFDQEVYVPEGFEGTMANGCTMKPGVKFCDLRKYQDDPDYQKLLDCYKNGKKYETKYHRFWQQSEIAIANGVMANLFPEGIPDPTPSNSVTPSDTPEPSDSVKPSDSAEPSDSVQPSDSSTPDITDITAETNVQSAPTTNTISGQIKVMSQKSIDVSKLSVRYYFTKDNNDPDNVCVDNAAVSLAQAPYYVNLTSKTSATVKSMDANAKNADSYIEFKFNDSQTFDKDGYLNMGFRLNKSTYSDYNQSNDYSHEKGVVVLYDGKVVYNSIPR